MVRRRLETSLAGLLMAGSLWAAGIPAQITYQGSLKEKGVPAGGPPKTMLFRITNQDGTQVYWSSGNKSVKVENGLFATQLSPSGVDWQNVTPYLEVSIEGQLLSPREPIAAGVYAMMSQSVVDGAVTPSKLDPNFFTGQGFGFVPPGAILMFANSCPLGWTVFNGLKGKFPVGADPANPAEFTAGQTGGNETHAHWLSITNSGPAGGAIAIGTVRGGADNRISAFGGPGGFTADFRSADTNSQSNLPPYLTVVFCEKR